MKPATAVLRAIVSPHPMRVSVREARMTLERIFLAAGIHEGLVPTVREHALMSAALGLGGWAMVRERHATIGRGLDAASRLVIEVNECGIDAAGAHAWLVGATILDLAIDRAHDRPRASAMALVASGVDCAGELAVLAALGRRQGVDARVTVLDDRSARIEVEPQGKPATLAERDPVLYRALVDGIPVDEALWWELHHLSNKALSPDTVESRRHAGPIIVAADGRIIGRPVDDETDVSLLKHAARPSSAATELE